MRAALATSFTAPFGGLRGHFPNVGWGAGRRRLPVAIQMRRFHQGQRNTMSADQSRDAHVRSVTPASGDFSEGTQASPLSDAVRAVQQRLGAKAAEQLALITKQDAKTSQRQIAQGRPPNGSAVYAMVRNPVVGPAFVFQATRDLPRDEREQFWVGMIVAAGAALQGKDAF